MSTPIHEIKEPQYSIPMPSERRSSDEENTYIGDDSPEEYRANRLHLHISNESQQHFNSRPSPSQTREQEHRLDDDLAMLQAERVVSANATKEEEDNKIGRSMSLARSRSRRTEPVDDFDIATNPVHEKNAVYKPPENPSTNFAKLFKRIHNSSFLVRYFTYIFPVAALLLIPLLFGALLFKDANVGGVSLEWFSIWLEIFWLTLWAGRILAKMMPWPIGVLSSLFTNNSKKWRDMAKQLEIPFALFFWWLAVEISFLPTMRNHMVADVDPSPQWQTITNRIIIVVLVAAILNLVEKIIIQLIAISFHLRTYADRIEINKFQIGSLVKLYIYSKEKIAMEDSDFEERPASGVATGSGARTPMAYVEKAQKDFSDAVRKVGDVGAKVAGDFTGKQVTKSTHPNQVILMLLNSNSGSQVLARRLYRTFIRDDEETVFADDMKPAFDNNDEADAAFTMFDKDLNGDISMEELEAVCVEIGRERKSITASLKDLDSVVSKLDAILMFIVGIIVIIVFITLISTSAAGVLTSLGGSVLALSWLFSATAQEFLQSIIFVFVKHPFDVGDRVTIYGNSGSDMKGDDYFVKEISLLYTEFKKMEGHIVQAPNSYLNTLFILNMRRTGGLAEAVPLVVKFGTTLDQIDELRSRLLEFVKVEKREYQANILTEVRTITEAYSVSLNVVFFYKSNWQNELLRLQRRNKFICALMTFMQEIGIEGPLMRLPGQKQNSPFYVNYPAGGNGNVETQEGPGPQTGSLSREEPIRSHHSILRRGSNMSRARGESVASMAKRVDFSLGMKGVASSDLIGDVHEESPQQRLPELVRQSASRSRPRPIDEESEHRSESKASGRDEGSIRNRFGHPRASVESHGNRFFGHGRTNNESQMERGMAAGEERTGRIDPRSGIISPQAVRTSTDNGGEGASHWNEGRMYSPLRGDDFEMKHFNNDK